MAYESLGQMAPALPPPGASFQVLHTPRSDQQRRQCEGAGGLYSRHCQQPGQMMPGFPYVPLSGPPIPGPPMPGPPGMPKPKMPAPPLAPKPAPLAPKPAPVPGIPKPAAPVPPVVPKAPAAPAKPAAPKIPDHLKLPPCIEYCSFPDGRQATYTRGRWQPPLTALMGFGEDKSDGGTWGHFFLCSPLPPIASCAVLGYRYGARLGVKNKSVAAGLGALVGYGVWYVLQKDSFVCSKI